MNQARIFVQIVFVLLLFSCESSLYPPTYPPVLSGITLTSSSSKTATTSVIQGDTVFLTVAVDDPEGDPLTLTISIQSGGIEIKSMEVNDSRIYNGISWETWFETDDLTPGDYTLGLTATDKEGNVGETLTGSFSVTTDLKAFVTTGDITITDVSHAFKDDIPGEPFTITFSVTNGSPVTIDRVHVPFVVTITYDNGVDDPIVSSVEGIGIITSIPVGSTKEGYLKLNIQAEDTTDYTILLDYIEANCSVTIY